MRFVPAGIAGAMIVHSEIYSDERGSFSRLRCCDEFAGVGLPTEFVQTNLSVTKQQNALRGLHFQIRPSREGKLVRCVKGRIYDVIVDLRPGSTTYLEHIGVDLVARKGTALFVPTGCAHGFMTRETDCWVLYEMTDFYQPELARGVRWNDPTFAIAWPVENPTGVERDLSYPDFDSALVRDFEE